MPYGRNLLSTSNVFPTRVANGDVMYKHGGITLDLTTIPAASGSDVTLPDGSVIKANTQFLRYGQIMTSIDVAEIQTVTFTGGPTAGNIILTLPAVGDTPAESAGAVAFNASAATMQAALQAMTRVGLNGATVTRSGAGINADPYIFTVTFNRHVGNPPLLTQTNTFTGGTAPTGTIAQGTSGATATGKYGPYDPAATDGRQSLVLGDCFILDECYVVNPAGASLPAENDIIGGVFDGGPVWLDRILNSGSDTHTLALGPTLAEVLAAFPRLGPLVRGN